MSSMKEGTSSSIAPEAAAEAAQSTSKEANKKGTSIQTETTSSTKSTKQGRTVSLEEHTAALKAERKKYKELVSKVNRLEKALEKKTEELNESRKQLAENRKRLRDETTAAAVKKRAKLIENEATPQNKHELRWQSRFQEMEQFKQKYGHCNVNLNHHATNYKQLAKWASAQRAEHKKMCHGKSTKMTAARARKLSEIGFQWKVTRSWTDWEARFAQLKQFKEEHGHLLVPQKLENPAGLGDWVLVQRKYYKNGLMENKKRNPNARTLTQEQIEKLEAIGFRWCLRNRTCQKKSDLTERQETEHTFSVSHQTTNDQVDAYREIANRAMAHQEMAYQGEVAFY